MVNSEIILAQRSLLVLGSQSAMEVVLEEQSSKTPSSCEMAVEMCPQ
jgi:hypothetical protein